MDCKEEISLDNFKKLCRICFKANPYMVLISTFSIDQQIYDCFSIQINFLNEFSDSICIECYETLLKCIEFKNTIKSAESLILSQPKTITVSITPEGQLNEDSKFQNIKIEDNFLEIQDLNENKNLEFDTKLNDDVKPLEKEVLVKSDIKPKKNKKLNFKILEKHFRIHSKINSSENSLDIRKKIQKVYEKDKNLDKLVDFTFQCKYCCEMFDNLTFMSHINSHADGVIKCSICNRVYKAKQFLFIHFHTKHVKIESFSCEYCEKKFSFKGKLNEHQKFVHEIKKKLCKICNKQIGVKFFKRHLEVHGEKNYDCDQCERKYSNERLLNLHKTTAHGTRSVCNICGKEVSSNHLKTHLLVHNDRTPKCRMCNDEFSNKSELMSHVRLKHKETNKVKKFNCEKCNKSYIKARTLGRHIKTIHENYRPFKCELCKKGFFIKVTYMDHMNTHTGNRPYACSICNETFASKGTLYRHKFKHTRKK